jgi:hypothetical protein
LGQLFATTPEIRQNLPLVVYFRRFTTRSAVIATRSGVILLNFRRFVAKFSRRAPDFAHS